MAVASAISNRSVCAICQDEILPDDDISKLNCDHEYHRDCLQPWLDANHDICPLDRGRITSINGITTELSEEEDGHDHIHAIEVQNPLMEARTLYQRSIRVFHDLSIDSDELFEHKEPKIYQLIFFSIFSPPRS